MYNFFLLLFLSLFWLPLSASRVTVGAEQLLTEKHASILNGKRIGLITNHTAVSKKMESTIDLLKRHRKTYNYTIVALFAPEHGITGAQHASENILDDKDGEGIPIYSLHGKTRRPTKEMLKKVDLLIYDIQDIGSRSYTYIATLFYAMEEAAKYKIPIVVLDRPNPINGKVIDGPMLEEKWRSIVGYINVPYVHGMTVGELAKFFNEEYKIHASLSVIPMKGWTRSMTFPDTGLPWVPTSPNIPEATTAFYYPITGLLGELQIVNIGVGYTLPFKLIGAPWINAKQFAAKLNEQKFPGIYFKPFYFKPFYGRFAKQECEGVLIVVTNPLIYKPVATQYLILGILKGLYPDQFKQGICSSLDRKDMFCKVTGTTEVYRIMTEMPNIVWKLRELNESERKSFAVLRKKYLIADYGQ